MKNSETKNTIAKISLGCAGAIDSIVDLIPQRIKSGMRNVLDNSVSFVAICVPFLYALSESNGSFLDA